MVSGRLRVASGERTTSMPQVHRAVNAGGKVLIPVMAVGRAQELLLLIESYWERMNLQVTSLAVGWWCWVGGGMAVG